MASLQRDKDINALPKATTNQYTELWVQFQRIHLQNIPMGTQWKKGQKPANQGISCNIMSPSNLKS